MAVGAPPTSPILLHPLLLSRNFLCRSQLLPLVSENHPLLVTACLVRVKKLGIHFGKGIAPTSHGDVGVENLQLAGLSTSRMGQPSRLQREAPVGSVLHPPAELPPTHIFPGTQLDFHQGSASRGAHTEDRH